MAFALEQRLPLKLLFSAFQAFCPVLREHLWHFRNISEASCYMKQFGFKTSQWFLGMLLGGLTACYPLGDSSLKSALPSQVATLHRVPQSTITLLIVLNQDYSEAHRRAIMRVFRELASTFAQVYPGTQIIPRVLDNEFFLGQIAKQTELGFGPDVILTSFEQLPILKQIGTLQSLDQYPIDLSAFREDALKQVTYQGQLYGIPLFLHLQALCYNKSKVKQLPSTLNELILQARQGYSVGIQSGFFATFWGTGTFGGASLFPPSVAPVRRQQAWQQWMDWLKVAQAEPNVILSTDTIALQQAFSRGQLAYLTCESSWIPYLREGLGPEKLGVVLLPRGEQGPATPLIYSSTALFNRFSSPAQTELALRFIQFLSNTEQQKKLITEKGVANISSNKRVILDPRLYPIAGTFLQQSQTAEAVSLDMFIGKEDMRKNSNNAAQYYWESVKNIERYYQKALVGEISTAEAARSISQLLNRPWEKK